MNPSSLELAIGVAALGMAAASLAVWAVTNRRWRRLLRSASGGNLESLLLLQQRQLAEVSAELAVVREGQREFGERLSRCVQTPGVVRFNAFADTGSDLSFSVALLDTSGGGVVLSSLYGREDSRSYAKPVSEGASAFRLTEEEREAIRLAWKR